jgi:hypothetical protein
MMSIQNRRQLILKARELIKDRYLVDVKVWVRFNGACAFLYAIGGVCERNSSIENDACWDKVLAIRRWLQNNQCKHSPHGL